MSEWMKHIEAGCPEHDRATKAEERIAELVQAVEYAAELYAKPTAYRTSKGKWSMNTSIGFETRFEELVELAMSPDRDFVSPREKPSRTEGA
jgi:hypothetical protein